MTLSLVATLLFAVSIILAAKAAVHVGPARAFIFRTLLAFVILTLWAGFFGMGLQGPGFGLFLLSGMLGFGLGDLAMFMSLRHLGPRLALMMTQCLAVPIAALMEWTWLGTTLGAFQLFASAVILTGAVLALQPRRHLTRSHLLLGLLLGVIAATGQASGAVISRAAFDLNAAAGYDIDGLSSAAQRMCGAVPVALVAWFWLTRRNRTPASQEKTQQLLASSRSPLSAGALITANAMAGPVLGVGAYQAALSANPSALVLVIVATAPLVVIPMSWWSEGDIPRPLSVIGSIMAVTGVCLLLLA